jgi:hypothetical protein
MLQTYHALLNNDCLQWLDQIPRQGQQRPIKVKVMIPDDELPVKKPELSKPFETVKKDKLLGLFADEADLIDQITADAMQARSQQPLRYFDEDE